MSKALSGMRIAILATDMVEEIELAEPRVALEDAGAETELIAPHDGEIMTANKYDKGEVYPVDATLEEVDPEEYDAVFIPGGVFNADTLRAHPLAQQFIQAIDEAGKAVAVICHGAWLLVSAGLVDGRTLTSYHTITDDVVNAGGDWQDKAVVIDENWVSSRKPDDIPVFNASMVNLFSQIYHADGLAV
jgi:protease I